MIGSNHNPSNKSSFVVRISSLLFFCGYGHKKVEFVYIELLSVKTQRGYGKKEMDSRLLIAISLK